MIVYICTGRESAPGGLSNNTVPTSAVARIPTIIIDKIIEGKKMGKRIFAKYCNAETPCKDAASAIDGEMVPHVRIARTAVMGT